MLEHDVDRQNIVERYVVEDVGQIGGRDVVFILAIVFALVLVFVVGRILVRTLFIVALADTIAFAALIAKLMAACASVKTRLVFC